jgi:hypothetical protein
MKTMLTHAAGVLVATTMLALAGPAPAQAASGTPPAKPRAAAEPPPADLERQLAAARERLEQAAREVATLTQQMAGEDVLRFRAGVGSRRAMLGVQLGDPTPDGVRIAGVSPGGPAATAGLKSGDVIVAIDGQKTRDARQVAERIRTVEPGRQATVDVQREGRTRSFVVVTREAEPRVVMLHDADGLELPIPDLEGPLRMAFERFRPWGELELATLTKDLGRYFGAERGVLVVRAPADGRLPLRDGDVITAIDGREPQSGAHALRILRSYQPGETLSLSILRDRRPQTLAVTMPAAAAMPGMPRAPGSPPAPPAPPAPPMAPAPGPA